MNKPMMKHVIVKPVNNSRGVTAVMVAMFMTVLLAMGAAAIDIGHALVARNELQNVSDAAALAGTRALGIIYEGMTPAAQQAYVLTGRRSGDRRSRSADGSQCEQGGRGGDHHQCVGHCNWDLESCDQNAHSHGQPTEVGTSVVEAGCFCKWSDQYVSWRR